MEDERPRGLWWESAAVLIALLAAFLFVSLAAAAEGTNLTGPAGLAVARALNFLFGGIMAFAVPALLLTVAVLLFMGKSFSVSFSRALGGALVLPAVTGMLALPHADDPLFRDDTFARAGALGTFMVEHDGLGLVMHFGPAGAAMILLAIGFVGLVLLTQVSLTTLAAAAWEALPARKPKAEVIVAEEAVSAARPARRRTLFPAEEEAVDEDDGEEEEPDPPAAPPAPRSGLFGRLFRRGRRSRALADPDPDEQVEPLPSEGFDEDALAAARALEEARIDEEYERALREEQARLRESGTTTPTAGEQTEIVFHDATAPLPLLSGNPANEEEEDEEGVASPDVGSELARLFPSRWEDTGGEVRRRNGSRSGRDAGEERELRRTARKLKKETADDDEEDFDEDIEDEVAEEEADTDPLFDEELDTRPAGAAAAREAASRSAIDEDEALRRREELTAYRLPDIELLETPPRIDNRMTREEMLEVSQTLEQTFADFNISVRVVEVKQGPVVTRFELKPAPGVKVSRIVTLEHDIALAMRAVSVRIVAPIPGKAAVGIEVPNKNRAGVYLKELVSCQEFWDHPSPLAFALGKTIDGQPYLADLKRMPHLLIAGATGAGKSVCLNTIITSFLYRQRPDRLRMIMVDPKRVELSIYQDIPHLISPVVCDAKRAAAALEWAVEQMEERYRNLVEFGVRNIDSYNQLATDPEKQSRHARWPEEPMPHLVIVVDELADLMVVAKNEVEESIQRLAQMSRAVGIHLILATQRPSVNVITGIIKANFPTRIAFQVSQKVDSRTILDHNGAEALLGRGDMLFAPAGAQKPIRLQGAFLSDEEVERLAAHCREQAQAMYEVEEFEPVLSEKEQRELARMMGSPVGEDDLDMQERVTRGTNRTMGRVKAGLFVPHEGGSARAGDEQIDEALVRAAARVILEGRKGSTSLVQRRLKVGFARAGRLMDMLEDMGIVGPYKGSKPREILVDCDAALDQLDALEEKIDQTGDSRTAAASLDGE